jgi:drug/metabolite transporter (DMT)-like permease
VGFDVAGSSALAASSFLLIVPGYALGPWIFAKYLSDVPALSVVASSLALCAIVYAPLAVLQHPAATLSASVIASMVGLMVVCTAVAFVVFFALIGEIGPMRATVVTYLNPAVAVLLGVVVLGEHFGLGTGAGFALVLSGSFLATRPLRPKAAQNALAPERAPVREGRTGVPAECVPTVAEP